MGLSCHAHLLRHGFAVVTLEQLQRGHIAALADLNQAQRGHYTRIFGDPLDWVRRRLGHRSVLTTAIYLHALQELEMETRMALVPDTVGGPQGHPAAAHRRRHADRRRRDRGSQMNSQGRGSTGPGQAFGPAGSGGYERPSRCAN